MEIWEKNKKRNKLSGTWRLENGLNFNLYFPKISLEHFNVNIESDFYHFKETVKTGMSQRGKANRITVYKKKLLLLQTKRTSERSKEPVRQGLRGGGQVVSSLQQTYFHNTSQYKGKEYKCIPCYSVSNFFWLPTSAWSQLLDFFLTGVSSPDACWSHRRRFLSEMRFNATF